MRFYIGENIFSYCAPYLFYRNLTVLREKELKKEKRDRAYDERSTRDDATGTQGCFLFSAKLQL